MRPIQAGSVDRTLIATAYNSDWSIKSDLAFDSPGISLFVQRIGAANSAPISLLAKASPEAAHTDGAFLNLGGGDISVDIPDAPLAGYTGSIRVYGTFTGGFIVGLWYPVVGYNPDAVAVGALTELGATAPAGWLNENALADGAISAPKLAAAAITSSTVADSFLTANKFAAGAFAAVWTVATRTLSAFGFDVTVATNNDKTGYSLSSPQVAALVAAIDAGLLDAGDATDLIASIVSRIGNTNVDEASLVAAIKASLFSPGSIANKLAVDGSGRVNVGTNSDKTGYSLAVDQAVNVTKVGGTVVTGPDDLKANTSLLALEATSQAIKGKTDSLTFTVAGLLDVNLSRWRGTQPGTLDSNGFVGSNVAAINGNTTAVVTFRTALDNNYFSKLNVSGTLAHTNNADSFKADVAALALETSVQSVGSLVGAATAEVEKIPRSAVALPAGDYEWMIVGGETVVVRLQGVTP